MTPGAIVVLSFSMSADAFAAAIGRGAGHRPTAIQAVRAGLVFGVIEAITPIIGWALGMLAADHISRIDHWIAFGLLALVGAHMIKEGLSAEDEDAEDDSRRVKRAGLAGLLALIATAVGTSIDAAAIGVGLAFIGANIWIIAASIGLTTFLMTTIGMLIGKAVGVRFGKRAELVGGIALICIGLSILGDHLGWFGG